MKNYINLKNFRRSLSTILILFVGVVVYLTVEKIFGHSIPTVLTLIGIILLIFKTWVKKEDYKENYLIKRIKSKRKDPVGILFLISFILELIIGIFFF